PAPQPPRAVSMRNIGGIEREYRRGRRAVSIRATPGTEKDDYSPYVMHGQLLSCAAIDVCEKDSARGALAPWWGLRQTATAFLQIFTGCVHVKSDAGQNGLLVRQKSLGNGVG
ncbi:hypothetical protein, partial [Collinsella tanakaei]|uniref:hypothetical protein n=1 Tax=Collinsella tanakaei TaxID=626935 RepID=UPI001F3A5CB3